MPYFVAPTKVSGLCTCCLHSLGMKDSWGPLKALAVASAVNGFGDVFLCCVCGYGIVGAAWATMLSQVTKSSLVKIGIRTLARKNVDLVFVIVV